LLGYITVNSHIVTTFDIQIELVLITIVHNNGKEKSKSINFYQCLCIC